MTTDKLKIEYEMLLNKESYMKLKIDCYTRPNMEIYITQKPKKEIYITRKLKKGIYVTQKPKGEHMSNSLHYPPLKNDLPHLACGDKNGEIPQEILHS